MFYTTFHHPVCGMCACVWKMRNAHLCIHRIVLPNGDSSADQICQRLVPHALLQPLPDMAEFTDAMTLWREENNTHLLHRYMSSSNDTPFSHDVIKAVCAIPCGYVTSYSAIACQCGAPPAARAVGRVLSHNPFPLIIPCHRVVHTDGRIGHYQGGTEMKHALLAHEDVLFVDRTRVAQRAFYHFPSRHS